MNVLIVESEADLAQLWKRHLCRQGASVAIAQSQAQAIALLSHQDVDVVVLDLVISGGSAFAVADYASFRRPETRVIFVTSTSFFSDGSIFAHCVNACAYLRTNTPPEDLVAMVEHYGAVRSSRPCGAL